MKHVHKIIILWYSTDSDYVHTNVGWMTKKELGIR